MSEISRAKLERAYQGALKSCDDLAQKVKLLELKLKAAHDACEGLTRQMKVKDQIIQQTLSERNAAMNQVLKENESLKKQLKNNG